MVGSKLIVALAFLGAAGLSLHSSAARGANYKLNCDGLGALEIREVVENDDLRSPLSDFLVISLPSGVEVKFISRHGANVWNWSNAQGIIYSSAASWPRDQLSFELDAYGIQKGTYLCDRS